MCSAYSLQNRGSVEGCKAKPMMRSQLICIVSIAAACTLFAAGGVASTSDEHLVSQKGRHFNPQQMTLTTGQSIVIVNDDADLMHHAYVESEDFNFDSGDQQPGSRTLITFTVPGDFKVLCGIHPKMKLAVHVQ